MCEIVTWRPELGADFERLNREWIEQDFELEEEDRKVFADPAGRILAPGGQVFFLLDDDGVRGTCAVIRHDAETYELAKMAVAPAWVPPSPCTASTGSATYRSTPRTAIPGPTSSSSGRSIANWFPRPPP